MSDGVIGYSGSIEVFLGCDEYHSLLDAFMNKKVIYAQSGDIKIKMQVTSHAVATVPYGSTGKPICTFELESVNPMNQGGDNV